MQAHPFPSPRSQNTRRHIPKDIAALKKLGTTSNTNNSFIKTLRNMKFRRITFENLDTPYRKHNASFTINQFIKFSEMSVCTEIHANSSVCCAQNAVSQRVRKTEKSEYYPRHVCLSVWYNSAPTGRFS